MPFKTLKRWDLYWIEIEPNVEFRLLGGEFNEVQTLHDMFNYHSIMIICSYFVPAYSYASVYSGLEFMQSDGIILTELDHYTETCHRRIFGELRKLTSWYHSMKVTGGLLGTQNTDLMIPFNDGNNGIGWEHRTLTSWYHSMMVTGGLAETLQVKYTSSPSFNRLGEKEAPNEAFTTGGSGHKIMIQLYILKHLYILRY